MIDKCEICGAEGPTVLYVRRNVSDENANNCTVGLGEGVEVCLPCALELAEAGE